MIDVSNEELTGLMECGYLNLARGKFNEAKEIFEGVAVLVPDSDVPQVALGNLYFDQGELKQALSIFQKAVTLKPASALARAYRGKALLADGKKQQAITELKKAIELDKEGTITNMAKTLLEAVGEVSA